MYRKKTFLYASSARESKRFNFLTRDSNVEQLGAAAPQRTWLRRQKTSCRPVRAPHALLVVYIQLCLPCLAACLGALPACLAACCDIQRPVASDARPNTTTRSLTAIEFSRRYKNDFNTLTLFLIFFLYIID